MQEGAAVDNEIGGSLPTIHHDPKLLRLAIHELRRIQLRKLQNKKTLNTPTVTQHTMHLMLSAAEVDDNGPFPYFVYQMLHTFYREMTIRKDERCYDNVRRSTFQVASGVRWMNATPNLHASGIRFACKFRCRKSALALIELNYMTSRKLAILKQLCVVGGIKC
jgi:hypothetical protein